MKTAPSRMHLIDGIKGIAMQIIVLHHFVSYGPLAAALQGLLPDVVDWLYNHGRMAVQVFLVIGGHLAARKLSPHGRPLSGGIGSIVLRRYVRLAPPYLVALLLAVACAAIARRWIADDDFIPAAPGLGQWLAHLLLLHDILDYDALSTGVWYVAIDFQLFVLFAIVLRMIGLVGHDKPWLVWGGVLILGALSMFWFNRDDDVDAWALYFFGAYALGAMSYWAGAGLRAAFIWQRLFWLLAVLALVVDFRWRLALALLTAVLLACATRFDLRAIPDRFGIPAWLAKTSYALFLVHFPVYMLVSAALVGVAVTDPWLGAAGMAAAWALSLIAAQLLHRYIEAPTARWRWQLPGPFRHVV